MKIGFTGARVGMSHAQHVAFMSLMWELKPTTFEHGACVGADEQAVDFVAEMNNCPVVIHAHPGRSAMGGVNELLSKRAMVVSGVVHPHDTHFSRNRNIVNASEVLVATPRQSVRPAPKSGGGTWMTVEYCEKVGKPVYIVWPDGRVDRPATS